MPIRITAVAICLICFACTNNKMSQDDAEAIHHNILSGEALAKKYCGTCHLFPSPNLLDKPTWRNHILPRMGYMFGIYEHDSIRRDLLGTGKEAEQVKMAGVFPEQQLLSDGDWEKIKAYYLGEAPEELTVPVTDSSMQKLSQFNVIPSPYRLSPPSTTLVKFTEDGLFVADAHTQRIYLFDRELGLTSAANTKEGAVWVNEYEGDFLITVMGTFAPSDHADGFVMRLPKNKAIKPKKIIKNLRRPVHLEVGDLNKDGLEDMVCAEFAKWTGQLSWWEQLPSGLFTQHVVSTRLGAIKSYIKDLNNDGYADIVAMFGQGDEGIYAFYNLGNGKFREEPLIQFPASYGSSYFNFFDFDNDGLEDIIYCAGDNGDYPALIKPYHGIRIFLNNGGYQFTESIFYHQNGVFSAIPFDFDNDGDVDIASISFFPDYENGANESFLYLENDGNNHFIASTLKDPTIGRWIVMDHKDWDHDGDMDLVLGSLAFEVVPDNNGYVKKWSESGLPFVILENTLY